MVEGTNRLVLVLKLEDRPEVEQAWVVVAENQVPPQADKADILHKVTTVLGKEGVLGTADVTADLVEVGAGPGLEVLQKLEAILQKL